MKSLKAIFAVSAMSLLFAQTAFAASNDNEAEGGVLIEENSNSKTGYTVTLTYVDEDATNVQLNGAFEFYEDGDLSILANGILLPASDSIYNHLYSPDEWTSDILLYHLLDTGYTGDMEKDDETGAWTISMDLPCGYYLYQYQVSYDDGETFESITDPENIPPCNEYGAEQTRSQFYVPYDEIQGHAEYYDWTWATPIEDEDAQGTIEYVTYAGNVSDEQKLEIYLPPHYDADREEPYKVLYLSHGGGGEAGDWFYQGHAANIVDRLIADGECEEFIIVCMNNADYDNLNYYQLYAGTKDYLIPYIEENYNVSTDAEDRAYAGLSLGAMRTTILYYAEPELFGYYGMFSASEARAFPDLDDYSAMMTPNIYLAVGYGDLAWMLKDNYGSDEDTTVLGFKERLDDAGITYNNGGSYVIVPGAHDWFTWPQILKDYVTTTLWK